MLEADPYIIAQAQTVDPNYLPTELGDDVNFSQIKSSTSFKIDEI